MISAQNLQASARLTWLRRAAFTCAAALAMALLVLLSGCGSNTPPYNDTPAIINLFPSDATAGGPTFTMNINGTGFISTTAAYWNNQQLTTTFNATTLQISASVPASFIATAGVAQVTVVSPTPGGGMSNAATFTINAPSNPTPTIGSLSPASTPLNVLPANNVLLVNGTNFIQSSAVTFNGVTRATTFVSATQLSVPVTAADVAANTTIVVTVSNPAPGGGVSNAASFVVGLGHNARLKSNAFVSGTQVPEVVSASASNSASNGRSTAPAISADGRSVAFYSTATNLVASGADGNIFVRDTCLGAADCTPQTIAVDLAADGSAPNGPADAHLAISGDGRFVVFASSATNLVAGAAGAGSTQVYVRDLCVGASAPSGCVPGTQLVSIDEYGAPAANASSALPINSPSTSVLSVSENGRFVAFVSGDTISVRDTCAGVTGTPCISTTFSVGVATGLPASGIYAAPAISADGRYVTFVAENSASANVSQVLLADMCLGAETSAACRPSVTKISVSADGSDLAGASQSPSISADGRFVTFSTQDANGVSTVWLRDTCLGGSAPESCAASTTLLSENASGASISATGRYVSYMATVAASAAGNSSFSGSLYVYDTCYGGPSGCVAGSSALPFTPDASSFAPMNADGSEIVFSTSSATAGLPLSGQGDVLLFELP
jgi:hypothetical protein